MRCIAAAAAALATGVAAINNGLGRTPALGWSSWNAVASNITSEYVRAVAAYLVSSGLAARGYTHVNVDEVVLMPTCQGAATVVSRKSV